MKTVRLDPSKLLGFHAVRPAADPRGASQRPVPAVVAARSAAKNGVKTGLKTGIKIGIKIGIKAT